MKLAGTIGLRRRQRDILLNIVTHAVLILVGFVLATPFAWLVSTSLKPTGDEFVFPPQWIPDPIMWSNYRKAMTLLPFHLFFKNTMVITICSLIGRVLSSSLVAFGFSRLRFPGRDKIFILVLSTMMLPSQVTLIPQFLVFRSLGWIDTLLPLIVPSWFGGGAFFIFLQRQFFTTIPYELDEAARVDGASSWWIWLRIAMPLSKPVLTTVAIFSFIASWNDFIGPLIYINSMEKKTLAVGLRAFQGLYTGDWNLMMAAATVMIVPILILFFSAQRYFVRGMVMSGMGGR